ncbi:MAG: DUF87 domain-containing protein [Lachnospiraceae bacterium]|nr:DUF87 domain-containing protein [Lachnospiraceae bacterium]
MDHIRIGFRLIGSSKIPISLSLTKYPHWLICGPSGSGKSYLVKYLIWHLLRLSMVELFVADFKNSGDYEYMDPDHLAVGMECIDMIRRFYKRYNEIKEANMEDRIILIFDEWAAYCLWAESCDKKMAKETKDMIAEILMMGRKLGSNGGGAYIWTVLQRPDAAYFGGSRENYFVKIIMKDVTKSIRMMLDLDEKDIPAEHMVMPGHGVCVMDNAIYAFIVPSYDNTAMEALLKAERERSRKQGPRCCHT